MKELGGGPRPVNLRILDATINYFIDAGYTYIDVPWAVSRKVTNITLPPGAKAFSIGPNTDLVGSAEQSFLYLALNQRLAPGRYVTCTPCFRDEAVLDDLHQQRFMKVELFDSTKLADQRYGFLEMMARARDCFKQLAGLSHYTDEIVQIEQKDSRNPEWPQYDLMWKGYELGSYGIREHEGFRWIYGTGVAEPRFSYVLASHRDPWGSFS